jgi:glutaredoxin 2
MHPEYVQKIDQLKQIVEYALDEFKEARDAYKRAEAKMDDFKNELDRMDVMLKRCINDISTLNGRIKQM